MAPGSGAPSEGAAPRPPAGGGYRIRPAVPDDLDALGSLEERAFASDRATRRQLRHLLTRAHAAVLVAEDRGGGVLGDVILLFSRGTATARLYSIAVAPEARGRRLGAALLEAAEAEAWRRERAWMRAEIRKDNRASIGLFESFGYRRFGEYADYYADHMDAWRYEKQLDERLKPVLARVPYYRQTLDFTCGPAALIMAMKALDGSVEPDRTVELRIWREATTIFMTSGYGGCGPFGLALAAHARGFSPEVVVSSRGVIMVESVRDPEKKEVMRLVQADMEAQMRAAGIPLRRGRLTLEELESRFHSGEIPLVLISSWQIYQERSPHWVVVTGFDEHFVYVHDPFVDEEEGEIPSDSMNMPIGRELFRRMTRYGRQGLQAAVLVGAGGRAA
ncbi:MAG: GNAT family N-acetyltransferase/peptidase C39 family protein [Longimicrobiales bacterium]|nr:GNAT family N-acetyltransferase/peptidase C39 family protein [Longimicrobiales bacterium]